MRKIKSKKKKNKKKKIYPETQNGETMIKIIKNMYKTDMHKTNTFMKNSTTSDFEKEALAYIRNI